MEHEEKPPLEPLERGDRARAASPMAARGADRSGPERPDRPVVASDAEAPKATTAPPSKPPAPAKASKPGRRPNNVRRLRIERMYSKAELARRANLSVLTIDRVEKGFGCRMDTKRKILEALGMSLSDRVAVFGEEE